MGTFVVANSANLVRGVLSSFSGFISLTPSSRIKKTSMPMTRGGRRMKLGKWMGMKLVLFRFRGGPYVVVLQDDSTIAKGVSLPH